MICAFMDRIDDSINTLNTNDYLNNESGNSNDFILFLVHTAMIVESVFKLFQKLGVEYPLNIKNDIFNELGSGKGTDDKFFKHIRALSFAHPIETSHYSPYVDKGETMYSPYVVNSSRINKDNISVIVYSIVEERDFSYIDIPKKNFIKYVESRYNLIDVLISYLKEDLLTHEQDQRSRVITISDNPIETVKNLRNVALSRYDDYLIHDIDKIIYALEYNSQDIKNLDSTNKLKEAITANLNNFVSMYEDMNEDVYDHKLLQLLHYRPRQKINNVHYMIEKIRLYLTDEYYGENDYNFDPENLYDRYTDSNIEWGFQQLKLFKKLYSDQFVNIDYNMEFNEIQLLVTTAIFIDNLSR